MKKAEDFRREMGPVDSGFHTVFCKTLEELQAEGQKNPGKKPIVIYPARVRIIAAAAALVLLVGAGILGITSRNGGLEPVDKIRGEGQYMPQTIEMALAQGNEPETGSGDAGKEDFPVRDEAFDPEKDVVQLPGMLLSYACTLPDGRVLLSGTESRYEEDEYSYSWDKARLVCLNTDGTVSWEYTGPEEKAYYHLWFQNAVVLKDGTIAIEHILDGQSIQFFSPDGNKIDKEMGPFDECMPHSAFLRVERRNEKGESTGTEVLDWDGNLITRIIERQFFGDSYRNWMQGDELVLYGETGTDKTHAKIVKMDGLTDKVLWEKVLDYQWQDTDYTGAPDVIKTEDGGYAALVGELKFGATEDGDACRYAVVKLDANGDVQWVYRDDNEYNSWSKHFDLYVHNGKIVMVAVEDNDEEKVINISARWINEEGKALGTTELDVKPEYFAVLGSMMNPTGDSLPRLLRVANDGVASTPDGLWVYLRAYVGKYYADTNELGEVEDSDDTILIRIPEPARDSGFAGADTTEDGFLAWDEKINSAREAIAGAYPDLDLLNTAEYGFEGNVQEWGTEVRFKTHNINHGDVQAAVLTDGTIEMYSADKEKAEDVNTLFRRYQSAYGRISRWKQETWVQLAKDIEPLKLNGEDPDLLEGKLLKMGRFPEESTVRISRDEACGRMWETALGEDDFCVLIDSDPHPVWKLLSNTWPVKRLLEIDAETGEVVADELCDTGRTPAYALFSTEKNRRALELKELGTKEIARREVRYAFAEMNEELEEPLPMPDFDNPEEYDVLVNGRVVRFTGRWNDLKTFELELDENGYVVRCDITDTISGQDRTKTPDEGSQAAKKEPVLLGDNELTEEKCLAMKEFLKPLNLSCEDRGIRIELLSGFAKGNEAWFQYTMKVLDEDKASNKSIPFFDCDFGSEKQQDSLLLNHDTTRQELTYCAVIQFDEPIDFSDRTVMVSLCQWSDESRSQKQGNWEYQFLLSRIAAEDSNK